MKKEDKEEVSQRVPFITKAIFWIAFISLLATSIPHVAWVYQIFELGNTQSINLWFASISVVNLTTYGIAIGIDIMAAWLTFTITLGGKKGNFPLWVFVSVLVAFSWYCNFLYAQGHNPNFQGNIWAMPLPFGFATTGSITPVLISAIPVLLIAYTLMWQQIGKAGTEDPEALAVQAKNLEDVALAKKRIRAAKRANRLDVIQGTFTDVKQVIAGAVDLTTQHAEDSVAPAIQGVSVAPASPEEKNTDAIPVLSSQVNTPYTEWTDAEVVSHDEWVDSVRGQGVLSGNPEPLQEVKVTPETVKAHSNGHKEPFVPPYRRGK